MFIQGITKLHESFLNTKTLLTTSPKNLECDISSVISFKGSDFEFKFCVSMKEFSKGF